MLCVKREIILLIRELITRFRHLEIHVTIDQDLLPSLNCADKVSTERSVSFGRSCTLHLQVKDFRFGIKVRISTNNQAPVN